MQCIVADRRITADGLGTIRGGWFKKDLGTIQVTSPWGYDKPEGAPGREAFRDWDGDGVITPHGGEDYSVAFEECVAPYGLRWRVSAIIWSSGAGWQLSLTALGLAQKVVVSYFHLKERPSLRTNQIVFGGAVVAISGDTGTMVTGPHLHVTVTVDGARVDPSSLMTGTLFRELTTAEEIHYVGAASRTAAVGGRYTSSIKQSVDGGEIITLTSPLP